MGTYTNRPKNLLVKSSNFFLNTAIKKSVYDKIFERKQNIVSPVGKPIKNEREVALL
jgi:hypothetical protein